MSIIATKKRDGSVLTWEIKVETGEIVCTVVGCPAPLVFRPAAAHPANRAMAELFGWKQRLADAAALERSRATGKSATPAEKRDEIARMISHYESGAAEWALPRAQGAGRASTKADTVTALHRAGLAASPADGEGLITKLAAKRGCNLGDAVREWAKVPAVRAELLEMERERLSAAPDTSGEELLAELLGPADVDADEFAEEGAE